MLNYPPSVDALVDTLFDEDEDKVGEKGVKTFSIRVIKYFEDKSSINWIVKRTADEFIENHQHLTKKLGLLKKFCFSHSKSSIFHHSNDAKHLDAGLVNEYLKELTLLNPIPMVVVTFLALENVSRVEKPSSKPFVRLSTSDLHRSGGSSHNLHSMNSDNNMSSEDSPLPRTSTYLENADVVHGLDHVPKKHRASWKGKIGGTSDIRHHSLHDFIHCTDQDLILKCFIIAYVAAGFHALLTGCRILLYRLLFLKHNRMVVIKQATTQYIKETMLRARYSLEGVVLALIAMMFIDKVFGLLAGIYFRKKLKTRIDGRYNVNFESICFRFGVGKNQVIFSGFEWKNPPMFDQTPYFIHIEEIAITFDMMSLYDAFFRFKSIKVHEICITNCNVYIEKIQIGRKHEGAIDAGGAVIESVRSSKRIPSTGLASDGNSTDFSGFSGSELHSAGGNQQNLHEKAEYRVNMWAAVGKRDYSEMKASSSSSKAKAVSVVNSTVTHTISTTASASASATPNETSHSGTMRRSSSRNSLFDYRSSSTSGPASGRYSTGGFTSSSTGEVRAVSVDNHFGASDAATRLREEMLAANTLSNSGKHSGLGKAGVLGMRKSTSMHRLSTIQSDASSSSNTTNATTASKGVRRHSSHGLSSYFHSSNSSHKSPHGSAKAALLDVKKHHHKQHHRKNNDDEVEDSEGGLKRTDSFYSINSADSFSEMMSESQRTEPSGHISGGGGEGTEDDYAHFDLLEEEEPSGGGATGGGGGGVSGEPQMRPSKQPKKALHIDTGAEYSPEKKHVLTENELAYLKNKRLFGFPYRLDISLLVFKNLQMHIQDLLNASHTDHSHQSTLKLATFSMSHEELTKAPSHGHHRKGVYMDEVMWRTVNAAMNELLKTNKVTLLSIFASAAANQTAAAVKNLTRRLFKSGKD